MSILLADWGCEAQRAESSNRVLPQILLKRIRERFAPPSNTRALDRNPGLLSRPEKLKAQLRGRGGKRRGFRLKAVFKIPFLREAVGWCLFATTPGMALTVLNSDGKPLAGASLEVRWRGGTSLLDALTPAVLFSRTDNQGRSPLVLPKGVDGFLLVDHPEFAPRIVPLAGMTSDVVTLEAGFWSGKLQLPPKAPGGRACAETSVTLLDESRQLVRCAAVDAEGEFRLPTLPWPLRLRVSVPGFVTWEGELSKPPEALLELQPGISVFGRVEDCFRNPLPGVLFQWEGGKERSAEDGTFLFGLQEVPALVTVLRPGGQKQEFQVSASNLSPIELRLACQTEVVAELLTPAGPYEGPVWVTFTPSTCPSSSCGSSRRQVGVIAGTFQLTFPEPGTFDLELAPQGYGPLRWAALKVEERQRLDLGVVSLELGGGFVGRVLERATGMPVPGATLEVLSLGFQALFQGTGSTRHAAVADREGALTLGGLPQGRFLLKVAAPGLAPSWQVRSMVAEQPVPLGDLLLEEGTPWEGRVLDPVGAPIAQVEVRLRDPACEYPEPLERTLADAEGRFRFPRVASGRYRFEVWREQRLLLSQEGEKGRQPETVELVSPGVELTGVLLGSGAEALPPFLTLVSLGNGWERRARLQINMPQGRLLHVPDSWVTTVRPEADGSFQTSGVPPGPLAVRWQTSRSEIVRIVEVPAVQTVELRIPVEGETLHGRVVPPPAGEDQAWVSFLNLGGQLLGRAPVGPEGSFTLPALSSGEGFLELFSRGQMVRWPARVPAVEELSLATPVSSGQATLRLGFERQGKPVRGVEAVLFFGASSVPAFAQPMVSGAVDLGPLPSGPAVLAFVEPLAGVGIQTLTLQPGFQEMRVKLPVGADLRVGCSGGRCPEAPLEALQLLTREGLDLAPLLSGWRLFSRMDAEGSLSLGRVAPQSWRIRFRVAGQEVEKAINPRPEELTEALSF